MTSGGSDGARRRLGRRPAQSVSGRITLLGEAAHPPLQYMAQGAVMAIEDGWVLGQHVGAQRAKRSAAGSGVDWETAPAAYEAVRPEHCRRVVLTARAWGDLWHRVGVKRGQRNAVMRSRETYDYSFMDWICGPTALTADQEPAMHPTIPLEAVEI